MEIQQLKQTIDLHDLAERLGLERPNGHSNYRSPHHKDNNPSLSIQKDGRSFKDFSAEGEPNAAGSCVDLVMYVEGLNDVGDAMKRLHQIYSIPFEKPDAHESPRQLSNIEYIAQRCLSNPDRAINYLTTQRLITKATVERCIARRTLGFNDYTAKDKKPGELHYGGDGVAFIVHNQQSGRVVAVDTRYLDPALNGGLKTKSQGEKAGTLWIPDPMRLAKAEWVYIVESAINALTIESYGRASVAAVATRGLGNTDINWSFLRGKMAVICMDNDPPIAEGRQKGHRPGPEAAWRIHEQITALDIPALLIDQGGDDWEDISDINDFARKHDAKCSDPSQSATRRALMKLEQWAIPGVAGKDDGSVWHHKRIVLPLRDLTVYWRYRTHEDFTTMVKMKIDDKGEEVEGHEDVAGFRVSGLSRVAIASDTSATSGDKDLSPTMMFAATAQTPLNGRHLKRFVMKEEEIHNVDKWKRFGAIFSKEKFSRLISIWERASHIGERQAVNFVGLCWRDGKATLNEGKDCYFIDPVSQCTYSNLQFHSGTTAQAAQIVNAYQSTFKQNSATLLLAWGAGAQLKAFLGFWPHFMLQADKGAGKSTLCTRLERTIGMKMLSGQNINTEFRIVTSLSYTSHPVGWEELSARRQDVIDKATSLLQEAYNFKPSTRGSDMKNYLISAPVLLAGEDVPVKTLLQKLVRTDLSGRRGPMMSEDLPQFPMREWILFLCGLDKSAVTARYREAEEYCKLRCLGKTEDDGAHRIVKNYAALLLSWSMLCEFSGTDKKQGGFIDDCISEMNHHIIDTVGDREPWVWIMEIIIGELDRKAYQHPYAFGEVHGELCLIIKHTHIMSHIAQSPALKDVWNGLPVKTSLVLKKQLKKAGLMVSDDTTRIIGYDRVQRCMALSIKTMAIYGLHPSLPKDEIP